ncbi:type III secretion apparatus lipoprotein, YscJ/HrcJ family [Roseibium sp. TrichSKD4]|uniref:type III secretion system inner membrane ring lipoprotein SctJ n=1 Tax=Roseibium sp. TrichSKD4 TaxID=744980 RepID=UPI0001E57382|nr:type III secretion inner membrane ring lipoprotein SctJ [Roseibium sp. TrichSKD4]EFO28571.1 type III secretion apparatus lipoprotein, YscJ/HrcJ family [Roseibium sp. TrichSKD4]
MYVLSSIKRFLPNGRFVAAILVAAFLAGCQSELYSKLDERDVNEMAFVLESNGISVSRERDSEGTYTLFIERGDTARAYGILAQNGLPRQKFDGLGEVFSSDKLVSTAFEEKARFIHAVTEELSKSISRIAGVTSAEVHITLPEKAPLEEETAPSRAAVFIYHSQGTDLNAQIPVIKNLVASSVERLSYEDVSVGLFPANSPMVPSSVTSQLQSLPTLPIAALIAVILLFFAYNKTKSRPKTQSRGQRMD